MQLAYQLQYVEFLKLREKYKLLVFWPHSVFGQNHLSVKML